MMTRCRSTTTPNRQRIIRYPNLIKYLICLLLPEDLFWMKNFVPWHYDFCLIFHSLSGEKETSESNFVFIILLKRIKHVKSVEKYNGSIYSILGRINFLCAFMDETGHLLSKIILVSKRAVFIPMEFHKICLLITIQKKITSRGAPEPN